MLLPSPSSGLSPLRFWLSGSSRPSADASQPQLTGSSCRYYTIMNQPLSFETLLGFVRSHEGQQFQTLARKVPFTVSTDQGEITITPRISQKPRRQSQSVIERVITEFERSSSFSPGHYSDITFDASYILAILHAITTR